MNGASFTVVGGLTVDVFMEVRSLPVAGETSLVRSLVMRPGGNAFWEAALLAALGSRVSLIGAVGDDPTGQMLLSVMGGLGIDVSCVTVRRGTATGCLLTMRAEGPGRMRFYHPGANSQVNAAAIEPAGSLIARADALIVQLDTSVQAALAALRAFAESHGQQSAGTFLFPSPARACTPEVVAAAHNVVVSGTEAEALSGVPCADKEDAALAARVIACMGAPNCAVTFGGRGGLLRLRRPPPRPRPATEPSTPGAEAEAVLEPAKLKDGPSVVSTRIAVPAFVAALAFSLMRGRSPDETLRFASAAGYLVGSRYAPFGRPWDGVPGEGEVRAAAAALA